jgi:predicted SprT family Zn-dependent metalloprotease
MSWQERAYAEYYAALTDAAQVLVDEFNVPDSELGRLRDACPTLKFKDLGLAGGEARGLLYVTLNTQLEQFDWKETVGVIRHEVAHVAVEALRELTGITTRRAPWSAHGAIWKKIALALGASDSLYIALGLQPTKKQRTWTYATTEGTLIEVSTTRHNRMQKNPDLVYRCKDSGGYVKAALHVPEKLMALINRSKV